jgi:hypothetical protein
MTWWKARSLNVKASLWMLGLFLFVAFLILTAPYGFGLTLLVLVWTILWFIARMAVETFED